ncbi:MAG: hypothetical protein WC156_00885 [Pedobacter sp.]
MTTNGVYSDSANTTAEPIAGPIRMVITNPSIPVKANFPVGLTPTGYTVTNEPYFTIVPQSGYLRQALHSKTSG